MVTNPDRPVPPNACVVKVRMPGDDEEQEYLMSAGAFATDMVDDLEEERLNLDMFSTA